MPIQPSDQYYRKLRAELINRTSRYERQVKGLYDNALNEISKMLSTVEYDPATPFSFEDVGLMRRVDKVMSDLENNIMVTVAAGVQKEFGKSYANCMEALKQVLSENTYDRVAKAFTPRLRSGDAAKRFMEHIPSVSTRVWNGTTLHQMETAVEGGLMEGWGASRMATHLKQFLNEPDVYYRRFRIKVGETEDGVIYGRKWKKRVLQPDGTSRWVDDDPKKYHPGTGVYRSSYKNALRYAGTTTNIAYRTADYERYQDFEFVLGIEIRTSENNHTEPDICDLLAGKYPKDFKWTGWHPNCRCYQVPILADESKIDQMADKILDGGDPADVHVNGRVEDVPDNFTAWLDKNAERIKNADNLPYFLADNGVRTDGVYTLKPFGHTEVHAPTALDIAKKRHDARTPEQVDYIKAMANERQQRFKDYALTQKRAGNFLGMAGEWHEVDFSQLQDILSSVQSKSFFSTSEMANLKNAVLGIKSQIRGQQVAEAALADLIPDVHKWHRTFTISDLQGVKASIESTKMKVASKKGYASWDEIPLTQQKTLLEKEMMYVSNPNYLKPHTLHATWEVAQQAYLKQIAAVDEALAWQATDAHLATVQAWAKAHKGAKVIAKVVQEAETLKANGASIAEVEAKLADIDKRIATSEKSMKTWLMNQGKAPGGPDLDAQEIIRLLGEEDRLKTMLEHAKYDFQQAEYAHQLHGTAATQQRLDDAKKALAAKKKELKDAQLKRAAAQGVNLSATEYGTWSKVLNDFFDDTNEWFKGLTKEERHAIINYTEGSGKFNRPLRGYRNSWNKSDFVGIGNVPFDQEGAGINEYNILSGALERSKLKKDIWTKRGSAMESFEGIFGTDLNTMTVEEAREKLIGKIGVDEAFLSSSPTKPWSGIQYHIYAPKDTEAGLVDPFSYFGGGRNTFAGENWTELKRSYTSGEQEILINRGYSYQIIDIRQEHHTWQVYMKVLDRNSRQIR